MLYLITGAAGFIGMHVAERLLCEGHSVVGLDSLNDYYDVSLKEARLSHLFRFDNFIFVRGDISNRDVVHGVFENRKFDCVVHLAAQAGVRYSLDHPHEYVDSNLVGFVNILDATRLSGIPRFVYASSSSVYGANVKQPFAESDPVDQPVSLYAATKRSNELIAYSYSHLYGISTVGLRFFTVYGPFGRPDMAYFKFVKSILNGIPIDIYNNGNMQRDFTYIDDIVDGVAGVLYAASFKDAGYKLLNIGNSSPVRLEDFICAIESSLGVVAFKNYLSMQPGDVPATYADISLIKNYTGFHPRISLEDGVSRFVSWYKSYYRV